MKKILWKLKWLYIFDTVCFVITVACIAMIPYVEKRFIEMFTVHNLNVANIIYLISMFAGLVLAYLIFNYLSIVFDFKRSVVFEKEIRDSYFSALLRGRERIWEEEKKDEHIQTLTTEITQLEDDYLTPVLNTIQGILQIVTYAVIIFVLIDTYIALGVLVLAVLGVVASRSVKNNASKKREEYLASNACYIGFIRQLLSGFTTIRQNNVKRVSDKEEEYSARTAFKRFCYGKSKAFLLSFNNVVSYFAMLLFFMFVVCLSYTGVISVAVAIVSFGYIDLVMEPINVILDSVACLKTSVHLKKKIENRIMGKTEVDYLQDSVINIEADQISCVYEGKAILSDFSYSFETGKSYLLCGPNGSGKSTLLKILSGVLPVSEGKILVNKKLVPNGVIYSDIYYIDQFAIVFRASFEENVTMFGSYDMSRLQEFEFMKLEVMKNIFDCVDCEVLSGGEKQLISLCRALISGARWILMDETFSGVSNSVEDKMIEEILRKGYNVIYITHNFNCEKYFRERIELK